MSAPPSVRPARAAEERDVARVLTDAFVDEAGLNYWLRQGEAKRRARERFFDRAVQDAVHPQRELWVAQEGAEKLGAAIWLSPGKKAYDLSAVKQLMLMPMMLSIAGVGGMSRGFALAEKLEALHPHAPHAHLVFLGVSTAAQGKGVGSAILKTTLAPLDASGTLAFLETTTPRNVALYERHGFVVSGELNVPGLQLWTMTREPR